MRTSIFLLLIASCVCSADDTAVGRRWQATTLTNPLIRNVRSEPTHSATLLKQQNISRTMIYGITPPSLSSLRSRVYIEGNWRHRNGSEPHFVCKGEDPGVQVIRNVVYLGRATFAMINPEPPQVRILRNGSPLTYPFKYARADFLSESATNNTRNFYQPLHTMGMDFHEVRIDNEGHISSPTLPARFLRVLARRGLERVVPAVVTNALVKSSWYENYAHFQMESAQYMMHGIIHSGVFRTHGGAGMPAGAVRTLPSPADAVPWSAAAERHGITRGNGGRDAHLFADELSPTLGSAASAPTRVAGDATPAADLKTLPRTLRNEMYGRTNSQTMTTGDTDVVPGTVVIPFHNPPLPRSTFNELLWSFSSYFDSTAAFGDTAPGGDKGTTPCAAADDKGPYPWPLCGPGCVWRAPPLTINDTFPIITGQLTHVRNFTGRDTCEITPVIGRPTQRHADAILAALRVNSASCPANEMSAVTGTPPRAHPTLRVVEWDATIPSHMLEQDPTTRAARVGCPRTLHSMPKVDFSKAGIRRQVQQHAYDVIAAKKRKSLEAAARAAGTFPEIYAAKLERAAADTDDRDADDEDATFLPRDEYDLLPLTLVRSLVLAIPLRIRQVGYFCMFDDQPSHESDWYPAATGYKDRSIPDAVDTVLHEAVAAAPRATLSPRALYIDRDKEGVSVIGAINALYEIAFRRIPPRMLPLPPVLWPEAFQRPEERTERIVVDYTRTLAALAPRSKDRTNQDYWVSRHMRSCARTPSAEGVVWGAVVRQAPAGSPICWMRRGLQMQDRIIKSADIAADKGLLPRITWGDLGWHPLREQAVLTHATDVMFSIPGAFDPSLAFLPRGALRIVPAKHLDWPHQSTGMWRIYRFHKARRPLLIVVGLPNCHLPNDYNCNVSIPTRHFLGILRKAYVGTHKPQDMPRHPFILRVQDGDTCPAASAAAHVAELLLLHPERPINGSILDFESFQKLGSDATMLWSPKLHDIHKPPAGCVKFRSAVQRDGDRLWPPDGDVDIE